jgi:poly-gamma-glutamate synthesis protein (capsule biosynthesis protein)
MEYQKEMGRYAIDCGADMVVGHHPHEPQPIEIYKGKPIRKRSACTVLR